MNDDGKITFDSVILAGGFGKRLLPLTEGIPKPMLPVAGEPAYARVLALLRKCGFTKTAVTTMYLPESIERFRGDARHSGTVRFFRESAERPLGSAGAVASFGEKLGETFCIISGDAVCDFALDGLYSEFLRSDCDAAMLLYRTRDAGEYGTVCVENGIVTGFCEKPSARDTLSDLINTGIYFFRREAFRAVCPAGESADFGRDVFPALLKNGKKIMGLEPEGYWFDIGSFAEYHRCNLRLSGGRNVVGAHTSLHPESIVEKSLLFDGATVGKSFVSGSIIGANAGIGNGCVVPPGCVIGSGAELRDGAVLAPGSIVASGATVNSDSEGYFPRSRGNLLLDDEHITADSSDRGFFVGFGARLAKSGRCAVVAQSDAEAIYANELACGVAGSGGEASVCVGLNPAVTAFVARELYFDRAVHIATAGGNVELRIYGGDGMPIPREETRALSSAEQTGRRLGGGITALPRTAVVKRYIEEIKRVAGAGKQTAITFSGGKNDSFASECAAELKTQTASDAVYTISADGMKASATLADGREISYWHLLAACCILMNKKRVALPNDTPALAESLLNAHAVDTLFYGDGASPVRSLAASERFTRDGAMLAFTLAEQLRQHGTTLESAVEPLSPFSVLTRSLYADRERIPAMISDLRREYGGGRCVGFDLGDGHVSIFPSAVGAFRIIAEAVDSETAEEISLRAIEMIEKREKSSQSR